IVSIKVSGGGEIAEYLESLATFATVGSMAENTGDTVNYVNAEFIAEERGIKVEVEDTNVASPYKNIITVKLTTEKQALSISATIFEDDVQRIVDFDGFEVDVALKGNMIIFKNTDVPGVIGNVGTILASHDVNISDFRLGRNDKSEALAVILLDSDVTDAAMNELSKLDACISVKAVRL
ncbi:MAG: ACT domain-containing protein, partial [Sulfurimonadaceae bacterium]